MKKLLSVIIAIVMIVMVVPRAVATDIEHCKHRFSLTLLLKNKVDFCENCGVKSADYTKAFECYVEFYGLIMSIGYMKNNSEVSIYRQVQNDFFEYQEDYESQNPDSHAYYILDAATEEEQKRLNAAIEKVYEYIDFIREEAVIIYDARDLSSLWIKGLTMPEEEELKVKHMFSEEFQTELINKLDAYLEIMNRYPNVEVEDEEIAEIGRTLTYNYSSVFSCIEGNHQYDVFTDNGDGTHTSDCTFCNTKNITFEHEWGKYITGEDGSKTARCKYCDATDTDNFEKDIREFFVMLIKLIESFIEAMFR